MPTYQYKCERCQREFEAVQRIVEDPLKECPQEGCKGEVKRLIPRTTFVLNGGGWFKDGY